MEIEVYNIDNGEIIKQKKMDENRNCSDCIHHDLCKAFEEGYGELMDPIGCHYYATIEDYIKKNSNIKHVSLRARH